MSSEDLIVTQIISRFDVAVETIDIGIFINVMKNVATMSYLVNPDAGTEMDMVIQKALTHLDKDSSVIPQQQLMSDAIQEKWIWSKYVNQIETNFRDYVNRRIRRILVKNLVV